MGTCNQGPGIHLRNLWWRVGDILRPNKRNGEYKFYFRILVRNDICRSDWLRNNIWSPKNRMGGCLRPCRNVDPGIPQVISQWVLGPESIEETPLSMIRVFFIYSNNLSC